MNRYVCVPLLGSLLCTFSYAESFDNDMAQCRRDIENWDQHAAETCKIVGQMTSEWERVAGQIEAQKKALSNVSNPPTPPEVVVLRQCAALFRSTAAIKCTGNNTNSTGGSGAGSPGSGTSGPSWTDSPDRQSSAGGEDDYMKQLNNTAKNLQSKVADTKTQGLEWVAPGEYNFGSCGNVDGGIVPGPLRSKYFSKFVCKAAYNTDLDVCLQRSQSIKAALDHHKKFSECSKWLQTKLSSCRTFVRNAVRQCGKLAN